MTTFLDSCFFISLLNSRDENHKISLALLQKFKNEKFGKLLTSDYILDEVITTIWGHTHNKNLVIRAYKTICHKPEFVSLRLIKNTHLVLAWERWNKFSDWPKRPLSFTDCTTLSLMEIEKINHLVTFDNEFMGLVSIINK
ncbi:MAG: type II toxin-antitoxin system VapC family toxin [Candidatus Hodarchaeales archaeon]